MIVHAGITGMRMQDAIPFSPPPATLPKSMVGYAGFDPLGFSTLFSIDWLREVILLPVLPILIRNLNPWRKPRFDFGVLQSELKHGRVAMLAAAGAIAQDLYTFPVFPKPQIRIFQNETTDNAGGMCVSG